MELFSCGSGSAVARNAVTDNQHPFPLWERLRRECLSPVLASFSKRYLCGTIQGTTGFLPAGFVPKFGE